MDYTILPLPLPFELETKRVLEKLAKAHRALAELKGVTGIIPNQNILINTLSLQEAKDSSAIENIITTRDELYTSDVFIKHFTTLATKEVYNYVAALEYGYEEVKKQGLITNNCILQIQEVLEENNAGFRRLHGTELKNERTGETVYTPPQDLQQILDLMNNLEKFINDDLLSDLDPLVKMAVIHHQFESIHPFYDGNGRTGRIINILYLVKAGLLDSPVLYLSRFINQNKGSYYQLLQTTRSQGSWEEWIYYILDAIEVTAFQTTRLIQEIKKLMLHHKLMMRGDLPKIYSQDLLNAIFRHPYTKPSFIERELGLTRVTATRYLNELTRIGLMTKMKFGKEIYFINTQLVELLSRANGS
ncbi:MAG: Fic family protein [Chlamydiae bacterium]|nr:Fic family protein [Chlamydiota bacterium]